MKYLTETIQELQREKRDLDRIIALLEEISAARLAGVSALQPRGRKFMSEEERHQVSERMKRYWAYRNGKVQSVNGKIQSVNGMRHKAKGA